MDSPYLESHTGMSVQSQSVSADASELCLPPRSVDILELSEQKDLLKFHYHTLRLYSAICALGNNRVAHALCSHIDEAQLLQAIENKYMPGNTHSTQQTVCAWKLSAALLMPQCCL